MQQHSQKVSEVDGEKIAELFARWGYGEMLLVGRGAFAMVYRVRRKADNRLVACKVSGERKMLRREGELMKKIRHPLFPQLLEVRQTPNYGFLFMEFVHGVNLRTLLNRRGRLSEKSAIYVTKKLADGLCYLHELAEPIIFRDLKPENVMICENGDVRLLDLGSAGTVNSSAHILTGTPPYAAPEQLCKDGKVGPHSDVYALGKVFCRMLGGKEKLRKWEGLVEECTHREVEERLPDMRCLMGKLVFCRKEYLFERSIVRYYR